MQPVLLLAIMVSVVLLIGLLGVRAVRFLLNFRKPKLPKAPPPLPASPPPVASKVAPAIPNPPPTTSPAPTLMRVGQVAPAPVVPPTPTPPLRSTVAETAVATPARQSLSTPASTNRYVSDPALVGSTRLFSVDQLRDRTSEAETASLDPADTPLAGDTDYAFGKSLTPFFAAALPDTAQRKVELKRDLVRAGYYQPHAFENIQAIRWLFFVIPLILLCILINVLPQQIEFWVIITGIGVAIVGWALPKLYIGGQAADRRSEIERSLPDILDMLNMCVSQGMTVIDALKRVTHELGAVFPALSQELKIVAEQAELGTLEQALVNFSRRVDAPDVHSFTSLLIQTERMGTSVSVALGEYAENMRESLKQRADEKANKATFQLLFPTVLFLMPSVYIFLLGPSIIKLTDFFSGNTSSYQQLNRTQGSQANQ